MKSDGIRDAVRRFLLDVILHGGASPQEWMHLVNAQTYTPSDVQRDATAFWRWLFDGEAVPSGGTTGGPIQPPQM
jgi:hypothetical protein